jgi:hypothetical protein
MGNTHLDGFRGDGQKRRPEKLPKRLRPDGTEKMLMDQDLDMDGKEMT